MLCIYGYMEMISRRRTILVVLLISAWISLAAQSQPEAEATSDPGVEKVTRLLEELRDNHKNGTVPSRTYELTEAELNAYLLAQLRQQDQKAVESLSILLKEGTFLTSIEVDTDQLELKGDALTLGFLRLLLKGKQTLEVEGKLEAANGIGTYRVQEARLSGFPIPASLVNEILSSMGQKQNPPFDPTEPFPMPFAIESVTVQPGRLILRTESRIQNTEGRR